MGAKFARIGLSDAHDEISRHWGSLAGPMDSFLEDHVRESTQYRILFSGDIAGFASIHGGSLVTQFSLAPEFRCFGQEAFQGLKKLENVRAALVPTCDEFYLSHAIDEYRHLAKQAYFFEVGPTSGIDIESPRCSLRVAIPADADFIRERSGDFFDEVDRRIEEEQVFLAHRSDVCVGFGILEQSRFRRDSASIGMFTIEDFRCQGVGTETIALLIEECTRRDLRPVAGCWYYNHPSKRALERAGMASSTRLLRIEY